MILLLINEKNKVQNCIYNLTQAWFKKKECREKVLGGNIPKYKQMFLLVDRIVGYTFTLLALHTYILSKFFAMAMYLWTAGKNGVKF